MKIGYARVSKSDGDQDTALQTDALKAAGVKPEHIYEDRASGQAENRPGLDMCMRVLRKGDTLIVWKLDRLGRNTRHLLELVRDMERRGIAFRVLDGLGAVIDTSSPSGKLTFAIFAAFAEYETALIRERTRAGLASARARGRKGGRRPIDPDRVAAVAAALRGGQTVTQTARVFGLARSTILKYAHSDGELRSAGRELLAETDERRAAG